MGKLLPMKNRIKLEEVRAWSIPFAGMLPRISQITWRRIWSSSPQELKR
jgi:hypothetical protein